MTGSDRDEGQKVFITPFIPTYKGLTEQQTHVVMNSTAVNTLIEELMIFSLR